MENYPPEVLCAIFENLDAVDQLTCRRVCRDWKEAIDSILATITHAALDPRGFQDPFIPSILFSDLKVKCFTCSERNHSQFFSFLASKCPNVKVFTAPHATVSIDDLVKIAKNILYFEVRFIKSRENDLKVGNEFSSLLAFDADLQYCNDFCYCKLPEGQLIQYFDDCHHS